ncbi:lipoyl synthase, partial [Cutibacterium acnes subsp. acnes]|nr:lipoyl synthase [Cutibacterium acnes subsp. acnes]
MSVEADGRKLLRVEVKNSQTPIENKPHWIKTRATMGPEYRDMRRRMIDGDLH